MKISISSDGEDDERIIKYILWAENDDFKGTIEFYGYSDIFSHFADAMIKFPFESKDTITFDADGIMITISLLDPVGGISFKVSIKDNESNFIEFNDRTVETEMLHELARMLKGTDFSNATSIKWDTKSLN